MCSLPSCKELKQLVFSEVRGRDGMAVFVEGVGGQKQWQDVGRVESGCCCSWEEKVERLVENLEPELQW